MTGVRVESRRIPRKKNPLRTKYIEITPKMAQKWLDTKGPNRVINNARVKRYADAMRNGTWDEFTGDTIKIGEDGRLMDGQHRLKGVVETGISIWSYVMYGLAPHSALNLDEGDSRTPQDALQIDGAIDGKPVKHSQAYSAAIKLYWKYEQAEGNKRIFKAGGPAKVSNKTVVNAAHQFPELRASTNIICAFTSVKGIPRSVMIFLHMLFSRKHAGKAALFMEKLLTGEDLSKGSPILTLRGKLFNLQGQSGAINGHAKKKFVLAITIKAWNAFRDDRRISTLSWGEKESAPAIK